MEHVEDVQIAYTCTMHMNTHMYMQMVKHDVHIGGVTIAQAYAHAHANTHTHVLVACSYLMWQSNRTIKPIQPNQSNH